MSFMTFNGVPGFSNISRAFQDVTTGLGEGFMVGFS